MKSFGKAVKRFLIRLTLVVALCLLAYFYLAPRFQPSTGTVVKVIDGDTCDVRYSSLFRSYTVRVRFQSIDAPERGQPYWREARTFVQNHILGRDVTIVSVSKDRYGRTLGFVHYRDASGDHLLNEELVSEGLAWWYRYYDPKNPALESAESSARRLHRGIWAEPDATAPWDYRKNHRN